jgi:Ca2+-transporting ATPase
VTDALPALTLIAEPMSPDAMQRPPRPSTVPIIGRREWTRILGVGALEAGVIFVFYWHLLKDHDSARARSLMFSTFVFSQLLRSFGARSTTRLFWEVGAFSNLWLLAVVLVTAALQVSLHFLPLTQEIFELTPLQLSDLRLMLPVALVAISVIEAKKLVERVARRATRSIRPAR